MITLKKTIKAGECQAMRCNKPAVDQLCPLHTKEWVDSGKPELAQAAKKAPTSGAGAGLTEAEQQAMVLERDNQTKALALANTFPVHTPELRDQLMGFVNHALERVKVIDASRKERVKPLNDTVKWINGIHNDVSEVYQKFADIGKRRIGEELLRLESEKREAMKVIAANAGSAPAEAFHAAHMDTSAPSTGGGMRTDYVFEVVDPAQVPEWCWVKVLDKGAIQGKLDSAAQAGREPDAIPGLRIVKKLALIKGAA